MWSQVWKYQKKNLNQQKKQNEKFHKKQERLKNRKYNIKYWQGKPKKNQKKNYTLNYIWIRLIRFKIYSEKHMPGKKKMRIQGNIQFNFTVVIKPTVKNITCSICFYKTYGNFILPCKHVFCTWCLVQHVRYSQKHQVQSVCPLCRHLISLEVQTRLMGYYYRVMDYSKPRRSSRASRAPIRYRPGLAWTI